MWAETVNLAVGDWNLGVRPDSERTARQLRALLGPYVSDVGVRLPSNFSLRRPSGFLRAHRGTLYIGGVVAGRSRRMTVLLRVLAGHLAGIETAADGRVTVELRAFARRDSVVLTSVPRPQLVDDRELRRAGVRELAIWSPQLDVVNIVVVPPVPLRKAVWRRHAGSEQAQAAGPLRLAALVRALDNPADAGLTAFGPRAGREADQWRQCVTELESTGRVVSTEGSVAARQAIAAALTNG